MRTARTKFFAVLLSVSMLVSLLVAPAGAAAFTDVDDWAQPSVDRWTKAGIMEGSADGTFDAEHQMTRAEFAVLLCKLMGYTEESDRSTFTDLPDDPAVASALLKLHKAGVMLGFPNNIAGPNTTIDREQTAVMVFRALGMKEDPNAPAMTYGDADQVSGWAESIMRTMTAKHMIEGDGTNVTPKVDIPKQEMATLLDKMVAVFVAKDGTVSTTTKDTAVKAETKNGTTTINAANHPGAVIVQAKKVTITAAPNSSSIVVAPGAPKDTAVTVTGAASDITVAADGAKVTVGKNAEVNSVTMSAANTQASISGKVDSVAVESGADSAKLTVAKGAEVTDVAVEAPKAAVTVSGTVGSVDIAASADNTTVKATTGAKVESVTTSADGVKIDGANKTIGSVVADAGSAEVKAKGAEVSNDGAEVKVDGKPVTEGNTTTSNQTGSGTSTGGGSTTTTPSNPDPSPSPSEPEKVTITFDGNKPAGVDADVAGIESATVEIDKDGKLTTLPDPTLEGYTFKGWNTEADGSGAAVTTDTTFSENDTIYAQWEEKTAPGKEEYTITFDVNKPADADGDATVSPATAETVDGKLTSLPTPVLTGYTFGGWYLDEACSDDKKVDSNTVFTSAVSIYAKWTKNPDGVYTITFDANKPATATGTVTLSTSSLNTDASTKKVNGTLPVPELTGYDFGGWFEKATPAEGDAAVTADTEYTKDTTLYAKWTAKTYTVTYDANEGTGTVPTAGTATYDADFTVAEGTGLTKTGFTFDGWNTQANGEGTKVAVGTAKWTIAENTTLYAQWKADSAAGDTEITEVVATLDVTTKVAVGSNLPKATITTVKAGSTTIDNVDTALTIETAWTDKDNKEATKAESAGEYTYTVTVTEKEGYTLAANAVKLNGSTTLTGKLTVDADPSSDVLTPTIAISLATGTDKLFNEKEDGQAANDMVVSGAEIKKGASDTAYTATGTVNYITSWEGFSSDTKLQSGNYLPIKLVKTVPTANNGEKVATISKVTVIGDLEREFNADQFFTEKEGTEETLVMRLNDVMAKNADAQKITIKVEFDAESAAPAVEYTIDCSALTLKPGLWVGFTADGGDSNVTNAVKNIPAFSTATSCGITGNAKNLLWFAMDGVDSASDYELSMMKQGNSDTNKEILTDKYVDYAKNDRKFKPAGAKAMMYVSLDEFSENGTTGQGNLTNMEITSGTAATYTVNLYKYKDQEKELVATATIELTGTESSGSYTWTAKTTWEKADGGAASE